MSKPIKALISEKVASLTTSERRVASAILADYPFAGLVSIQELATHVRVSAPSVSRFVHKLGCAGYSEFQRCLIDELRADSHSPLELKRTERALAENDFLPDYIERIISNLESLVTAVQASDLDTICVLMADYRRSIYLLGGRVSDTIAFYMFMHLRQLRPKVFHLSSSPEINPDQILAMQRQDVVFILDFRRYQPDLAQLASLVAHRSSCTIILVTDRWISPIGRHADYVVSLPIETMTAWDSYTTAFAFVESIIARISEKNWDTAEERIRSWDELRFAQNPALEPGADE